MPQVNGSSGALLAVSVGVVVLSVIILWRVKQRKSRRMVGRVGELLVYPIKSGPPLKVQTAVCKETGLKYHDAYDRQFMIVSNNEYIRLRDHLSMLNLQLSYDELNNCLRLQAPGMTTELTVPLQPPSLDSSLVKSVMWYDKREVPFVEVSRKHSRWFSQYLAKECLFVTAAPEIRREVNPVFTYNQHTNRHPDTKINFAASHPYLLINDSSINELNSRMSDHVTNDTFRGNIVIAGDSTGQLLAYDEDAWGEIYIGRQAVLFNERPCPRCANINVKYPQLEMNRNHEPTKTLMKYRRGTRGKDKYVPMFGSNCSLISEGTVSVGDVVMVRHK